ncbi:Phage protein Gp19/Gp15/Gp42 [Corynebacterium kalinowskii]|uniref:Phage protein Gp19/Gp15/Gp42 n=1 Tax=Corynebacterium kalinowskii TaxID=2675216 RepID=A0A6B8VNV6_9CORY|nr:hypothetical protein [Corynebacterium kalinowskii]QGU03104.1 Phage protein Gp19/Gp15/Gp42 [Corynebacterium kalinowskii]
MAGYATADDLRTRWRQYPADLSDEMATALLDDASTWLSVTFPSIPEVVTGKLADVLKIVVCAMARRALIADVSDGADQITDAAGPFSTSLHFRNSEGNLFITGQEREMIEAALDSGADDFKCISAEGW